MIGSLPLQLRLDLPLRRDASGRFLPWIIALMVYLAAMGGVGLIWLGDTLSNWDAAAFQHADLAGPGRRLAGADRDGARRAAPDQGRRLGASCSSRRRRRTLLEPWLGSSVPIDSLPLPRLVDVRIDPRVAIDYGDGAAATRFDHPRRRSSTTTAPGSAACAALRCGSRG